MASQDYPVKDANGNTIIPSGRGEGPKASVDISALAVTWNNAGTTFTGIKLDVTDTASQAASMLMDLRVGGTSKFAVRKDSRLLLNADGTLLYSATGYRAGPRFSFSSAGSAYSRISSYGFLSDSATAGLGDIGWSNSTGLSLGAAFSVGWGSTPGVDSGAAADTLLYRDGAAGVLAQRNGANAQAFRLYNTYTDASNYERGDLGWESNTLTLAARAGGTGTARSVRILAGASSWTFSSGGSFGATGGGSFGSAVWFADGVNAGAPGITFSNETNTGFWRSGSGVLAVTVGGTSRFQFTAGGLISQGGYVRMAVTTVGALPAAATAGSGARMMVSDASAPTFGATVAGGGAVVTPVYSDGTNWKVG